MLDAFTLKSKASPVPAVISFCVVVVVQSALRKMI